MQPSKERIFFIVCHQDGTTQWFHDRNLGDKRTDCLIHVIEKTVEFEKEIGCPCGEMMMEWLGIMAVSLSVFDHIFDHPPRHTGVEHVQHTKPQAACEAVSVIIVSQMRGCHPSPCLDSMSVEQSFAFYSL